MKMKKYDFPFQWTTRWPEHMMCPWWCQINIQLSVIIRFLYSHCPPLIPWLTPASARPWRAARRSLVLLLCLVDHRGPALGFWLPGLNRDPSLPDKKFRKCGGWYLSCASGWDRGAQGQDKGRKGWVWWTRPPSLSWESRRLDINASQERLSLPYYDFEKLLLFRMGKEHWFVFPDVWRSDSMIRDGVLELDLVDTAWCLI